MSNEKEANFIELKSLIATAAVKDRRLWEKLKDPKELEKMMGPPKKWGAKKYKIVENTKDKIYLVMPNATAMKTLSPPKEFKTPNAYYIDTVLRINKDKELRKRYFADPKGTLQKEFSKMFAVLFSDNITLEVLEDDDQVIHFVLPSQDSILSDEELSMIAGGLSQTDFRNSSPIGRHGMAFWTLGISEFVGFVSSGGEC